MALVLQRKGITGCELRYGCLPPRPDHCRVALWAHIGEKGKKGADDFGLTVLTPKWLQSSGEALWGRSCLILPEFSWEGVERELSVLLRSVKESSWAAAGVLGDKLSWEYAGYPGR